MLMDDKIIIKNIHCFAVLGINPEERINKQNVVVNVTLHNDIEKAAVSRNIEDAVNYYEVAVVVKEFVEQAAALLVETLVTDIANLLLTNYQSVSQVTVRVEKPDAVPFAESVGVEIVRKRV